MAVKFYRVKQDTFIWKEGAVISNNNHTGGYQPIDDLWNVTKNQSEYITKNIIEDPANEVYFERVYQDTLKGNLYRTKDQMIALYRDAFKG